MGKNRQLVHPDPSPIDPCLATERFSSRPNREMGLTSSNNPIRMVIADGEAEAVRRMDVELAVGGEAPGPAPMVIRQPSMAKARIIAPSQHMTIDRLIDHSNLRRSMVHHLRLRIIRTASREGTAMGPEEGVVASLAKEGGTEDEGKVRIGAVGISQLARPLRPLAPQRSIQERHPFNPTTYRPLPPLCFAYPTCHSKIPVAHNRKRANRDLGSLDSLNPNLDLSRKHLKSHHLVTRPPRLHPPTADQPAAQLLSRAQSSPKQFPDQATDPPNPSSRIERPLGQLKRDDRCPRRTT